MKAWLAANWKPLLHTALTVVCYALYRYAPQLAPERELLIALAVAWGAFGTAVVPSFARLPPESAE